MKILINGIGRSGTSLLTEIIKSIIFQEKKVKPNCILEPFLWGENVWNIDYQKQNHLFEKMSSISYEGVFNHLKLPLFITDPNNFLDNVYLRKILGLGEINIIKFVRGLGRIKLLHAMEPSAKHVFIIRNPIDTMNSVLTHGSFFGDEWHTSDDLRMFNELKQMNYPTFKNINDSLFEKELEWWYSMNKFYLEETNKLNIDVLYLSYENLVNNFEVSIIKICKHLEIKFNKSYLNLINEQRGSKSKKKNLTRKNLDQSFKYISKYEDLIKTYNIDCNVDLGKVYNKYINNLNNKEYDRSHLGLTLSAYQLKLKKNKFIYRLKYFFNILKKNI